MSINTSYAKHDPSSCVFCLWEKVRDENNQDQTQHVNNTDSHESNTTIVEKKEDGIYENGKLKYLRA
jgi:hypothetical protein